MAPEMLNKVKDFVMKYGLPAGLFVGGYFSGDVFKLKDLISGLIPADIKLDSRVIGIVVGAIFLGIAVAVWSLNETFGPSAGAFIAGIGVNVLITSLKGA